MSTCCSRVLSIKRLKMNQCSLSHDYAKTDTSKQSLHITVTTALYLLKCEQNKVLVGSILMLSLKMILLLKCKSNPKWVDQYASITLCLNFSTYNSYNIVLHLIWSRSSAINFFTKLFHNPYPVYEQSHQKLTRTVHMKYDMLVFLQY